MDWWLNFSIIVNFPNNVDLKGWIRWKWPINCTPKMFLSCFTKHAHNYCFIFLLLFWTLKNFKNFNFEPTFNCAITFIFSLKCYMQTKSFEGILILQNFPNLDLINLINSSLTLLNLILFQFNWISYLNQFTADAGRKILLKYFIITQLNWLRHLQLYWPCSIACGFRLNEWHQKSIFIVQLTSTAYTQTFV